MRNNLCPILIVCYASACLLSALSPIAGVVFLVVSAGIITLPYFLMMASKIFLRGVLISVVLMILAVLCPPLAILAILWGALSLMLKFWRLCRNLPLIFSGLVLYGLVYFVPRLACGLVPATLPTWIHAALIIVAVGLSTLAGFCVIRISVACFCRLGYSQQHAAAVLLGFSGYLVIFLLSFLIPGIDGDSGGDGSFGHEG